MIADRFLERTQDWLDWSARFRSRPIMVSGDPRRDHAGNGANTRKPAASWVMSGPPRSPNTRAPKNQITACWLRDSFFTVIVLNALGVTKTMEDYLDYVLNRDRGAGRLHAQPLFGLGHERIITEEECSICCYRGNRPAARPRLQAWSSTDGYGSVILVVSQCFFDERLPRLGAAPTCSSGSRTWATRRWRAGTRPTPACGNSTCELLHTHSALMRWGACESAGASRRSLGWPSTAPVLGGHSRHHPRRHRARLTPGWKAM